MGGNAGMPFDLAKAPSPLRSAGALQNAVLLWVSAEGSFVDCADGALDSAEQKPIPKGNRISVNYFYIRTTEETYFITVTLTSDVLFVSVRKIGLDQTGRQSLLVRRGFL